MLLLTAACMYLKMSALGIQVYAQHGRLSGTLTGAHLEQVCLRSLVDAALLRVTIGHVIKQLHGRGCVVTGQLQGSGSSSRTGGSRVCAACENVGITAAGLQGGLSPARYGYAVYSRTNRDTAFIFPSPEDSISCHAQRTTCEVAPSALSDV